MSDGLARVIVCFGDSLTAGYQSLTGMSPSITSTPYGTFLREYLGGQARVIISGICGELTRDMVQRYGRDVIAPHPDDVIILGGTNDLGWNVPPAEITEHLQTMYVSACEAGIRPIALTIPSLRAEDHGVGDADEWIRDHVARRVMVNQWISGYCTEKNIPCVDLFTAMAEPGTRLLARHYSNDGLHLTTEGYRKIAELLYDHVFNRP